MDLSQQGTRAAATSGWCYGSPGFSSLWQSHVCVPRLSLWKHLPELRTKLPPLTGPRKERWPLRMQRWGTRKTCLWSWRKCPLPSNPRRRLALWGGRDQVRLCQGLRRETFEPTGFKFGAHDWLFIEYYPHPFKLSPCRRVTSVSYLFVPLFPLYYFCCIKWIFCNAHLHSFNDLIVYF